MLLGAGVVVFGLAAVLVHNGAPAWDATWFRAINETPHAVADVLTPLARLFSPVGLAVAVAAAAIAAVVRSRSVLPLLVGASAGGAAWLIANLTKAAADRPRPYEVVAGAILRQSAAHGTSFPSTHTAVAVAAAIAVLPFLPRPAAWGAIAFAVCVGWSRIYLGVHYPLDVLGGAGIGMAVGGAALLVLGNLAGWPAQPSVAGASPDRDEGS